jgi:hypothetical protein
VAVFASANTRQHMQKQVVEPLRPSTHGRKGNHGHVSNLQHRHFWLPSWVPTTAGSALPLTSTPSWPPDSRYTLSLLKHSDPTGCACQCTVVTGGMDVPPLRLWPAPPMAASCAARTAVGKSCHSRMRPLTSPAARMVSVGSMAAHCTNHRRCVWQQQQQQQQQQGCISRHGVAL